MARKSVIIGIIMLAAWIVPLFGVFLAVIGLALGIADSKRPRSDMARAGIFLNSLGLCLSLINVSVSMYLFFSGVIDPAFIIGQLN